MSFHSLIDNLLQDTLSVSLGAFAPELAVCATIISLLLVRMIASRWEDGPFYVMLVGSATACFLAMPWEMLKTSEPVSRPLFTGLLMYDGFAIFMRCLLLFFLLLFTTFTQVSGIPRQQDATEFYVLLLGAVLGMCLMVSANHMMIVFLAVEMASVPSYVLAGMLRNRRRSSEASLKYAVFGAGAAGVMLYGISLLVGTLGSAHIPTMAAELGQMLRGGIDANQTTLLVLGGLMLMVGVAYKLSAVPFHFWVPDVFEGATAEVAGFLSIASKAAALALLVRLAMGFGYVSPDVESLYPPPATIAAAAAGAQADDHEATSPHESGHADEADDSEPVSLHAALKPVRGFICGLIGLLAAVTCTFGNLAAYGQTNMKRLLAYSTIAHAGYMMMAVAGAAALAGENPRAAEYAVAGLMFYIAVYMFMNLGAFAIVAFVRNVAGSEEIDSYRGLIRRSPGLTICLSIIMFSLLGLPPLAGFTAKFAVFAPLAEAGLWTLLGVGVFNSALSLFYYLRVVRVTILEEEPADQPAPTIPLLSIPGVFVAAITAPLILLFVFSGGLLEWARTATWWLLP